MVMTSPDSKDQNQFDVIVAGAGIAGTLAALRLAVGHLAQAGDFSPLKILLLEKEAVPGGRLRSLDDGDERPAWGYGLNGVSKPLIEFWQQTMRSDPDSVWDPDGFAAKEQDTLGILSGSELSTLPITV